jgi:hypothetical protein
VASCLYRHHGAGSITDDVDARPPECSDAALFQVSHAAVHGVKRETGTFLSNKSGAAPATVGA